MNSPSVTRKPWTYRAGKTKIAVDGNAAVMLPCPGTASLGTRSRRYTRWSLGRESANEAPWLPVPDGPPFSGPGLLARVAPFALVAVAAEASLALPPGTHAWLTVTVSLVLLAATGLAFLLPWNRLPAWASVLVPLAYTGSVLALTLAAGTVSGVGIVILVPLIWTTLFHRRWESACVVAAIVAAEIVVSLVQSAPDAVIVRRVLLWGALGALLAVATHGLRDRIRRSQEAAARLQEQIGELMLVQDRDRLAADLQGSVVQRIFAAGLNLQSVLSMVTQTEVRRRVETSVADLDDAIRLLRQAIFGLENRMATQGLRHQVLHLCADVSPVPEITFAGTGRRCPASRGRGPAARPAAGGSWPAGNTSRADIHLRRGRRAPQRHRDRNRPAAIDAPTATGRPATSPRCESGPARTASRSRSSRSRTGPGWPGACPCRPRTKVPRTPGERP